jgi:hypothetical protein
MTGKSRSLADLHRVWIMVALALALSACSSDRYYDPPVQHPPVQQESVQEVPTQPPNYVAIVRIANDDRLFLVYVIGNDKIYPARYDQAGNLVPAALGESRIALAQIESDGTVRFLLEPGEGGPRYARVDADGKLRLPATTSSIADIVPMQFTRDGRAVVLDLTLDGPFTEVRMSEKGELSFQ